MRLSQSPAEQYVPTTRMAMKTRKTLPLGFFSLLSSIWIAAFLALTTCALAQAPSGNVVISSNTTWASGNYSDPNYPITSLTVQGGATLTVGGGSTVTVIGAILVTGNSTIVVQGSNNTGMINVPGGTQWQGGGSCFHGHQKGGGGRRTSRGG